MRQAGVVGEKEKACIWRLLFLCLLVNKLQIDFLSSPLPPILPFMVSFHLLTYWCKKTASVRVRVGGLLLTGMPGHVEWNSVPYLVCLKVTKFLEEYNFQGIRKNPAGRGEVSPW